MNKTRLFDFLEKQKSSFLIELLRSAYDELNAYQRNDVFGKVIEEMPLSEVNGDELLEDIKIFHSESLAGYYYEPFQIDSKNFSDIPEETEEWFEKLGDFLKESMRLTEQGKHSIAIECFKILYELIEKMEEGQEIVFADEIGSWMIPGDEKEYINAYLSASAAITTPEEYAEIAIPLIRRDSYSSLVNKTYSSAIKLASEKQKSYPQEEVKRKKIRTKSK
jgi:hypothetical protein